MPAPMSAGPAQPRRCRDTPVTRHPPPVPCGARHRAWRIGEMPVPAGSAVMTALLAGCASAAPHRAECPAGTITGRRRRAPVPFHPADRPGHHDRPGTRPTA
jgi:hypothetical protein